jgi:hypothetical protein
MHEPPHACLPACPSWRWLTRAHAGPFTSKADIALLARASGAQLLTRQELQELLLAPASPQAAAVGQENCGPASGQEGEEPMGGPGLGKAPVPPALTLVLADPELCKSSRQKLSSLLPAGVGVVAVGRGQRGSSISSKENAEAAVEGPPPRVVALLSYKWLLDCVGSQRVFPAAPHELL